MGFSFLLGCYCILSSCHAYIDFHISYCSYLVLIMLIATCICFCNMACLFVTCT